MTTPLVSLAIINPISGSGKKKNIEANLAKHLDKSKFELHIKHTRYAGHGSELAKEAIANGYDLVLAVGGDGTINEIAKSLVFSNVALGVIPCGSGNGFARHLKIPMNTTKAIKSLNKASIKKIDTVKANNHRFINVAGIGFDALVAHEFAKLDSRGLSNYIKAVVKCFSSFPNQTFVLKNKKHKSIEKCMMLSFANSSQFGNNAYIAPTAKIDDGKINLSILRKPKWFQIPALTYRVFTKTLNGSSLFSQIITDELRLVQESDLGHVDGEPIFFGKNIHIKIDPLSLKVLY